MTPEFDWDSLSLAAGLHQLPGWVQSRSLFVVRAGSHAYGTALPESDRDYRGVFVHPLDQYLGTVARPTSVFERKREGLDIELREVRTFFRLVAAGNPNVVEQLFVDDEDILERDDRVLPFFERRQDFLSQHTYAGLRGFAYQLYAKLSRIPWWEEKDLKMAAQATRLVRMAEELLTTHALRVRRPDAEYLLQIRKGSVDATTVLRDLGTVFQRLDDIAAERIRELPVDVAPLLHRMCAQLVRDFTENDEL